MLKRFNSHKFIKSKEGLTILEVLMTMSVFAIGFLAVGTMVLSTSRNNTTGDIITQATMLARERIEFLKSLPIDQMEEQCAEGIEPEHMNGIFKRNCDIDTSFPGSANIIEVKVSWRRQGKDREVVLKTLTRGNGT